MNFERVSQVNHFYFREARLLDERCYQQWLQLLSPQVEYIVSARHIPQLDNSQRDTEAFLNRSQEFNTEVEPPIRDEKHLHLMIRVMRSLKMIAWTENPPARTRRFVSNIEIVSEKDRKLEIFSNTLLYYSRHEHQEHLYSYQRKDMLEQDKDDFKILRREVLLDCVVIPAASAGLFF